MRKATTSRVRNENFCHWHSYRKLKDKKYLYWAQKSAWGLDAGNYSFHQYCHLSAQRHTGFLKHTIHPIWHPNQHLESLKQKLFISHLHLFVQSVYLLTPCSRALLEKLTSSQLVKKFPAFYGTQRFITAFTSVHHLSQPWTRSIHSTTHIPLPVNPS